MKKLWILPMLLAGCDETKTPQPVINTQIANPSATYCIQQGHKYESRKQSDGGEYGVCVFKNGSECEAWAYFKGECKK